MPEDGIDVDVWVNLSQWQKYRIPDVIRHKGQWWLRAGVWMIPVEGVTHWRHKPEGPDGDAAQKA